MTRRRAPREDFERCRDLRKEDNSYFELGDVCWIDPNGPYAEENDWVTEKWILGRGAEWVVRAVSAYGVYASYKVTHAPTFFEFCDLVPWRGD